MSLLARGSVARTPWLQISSAIVLKSVERDKTDMTTSNARRRRVARSELNRRPIVIRLPAPLLKVLDEQCDRLDRPRSWIMTKALLLALEDIKKIPPIEEDFLVQNHISEDEITSVEE